jgi:hypothetical protein
MVKNKSFLSRENTIEIRECKECNSYVLHEHKGDGNLLNNGAYQAIIDAGRDFARTIGSEGLVINVEIPER